MLRSIKDGGDAPAGLVRQGSRADGDDGIHAAGAVGRDAIERARAALTPSWAGRRLVIVDGFLLFGPSVPASLRDLFDVKVLLRARYEEAKARRARRNGYVTLEGFWADPEGYFDEVVWPNYEREYGGLVAGVGEGGGRAGGVWVSGLGWGVEECLGWVGGVLGGEVEGEGEGAVG